MLSCLCDDVYKRTLAANQRVAYVMAAGFLSHYLNGLTPYNVTKCVECVVKLKHFLSSLYLMT